MTGLQAKARDTLGAASPPGSCTTLASCGAGLTAAIRGEAEALPANIASVGVAHIAALHLALGASRGALKAIARPAAAEIAVARARLGTVGAVHGAGRADTGGGEAEAWVALLRIAAALAQQLTASAVLSAQQALLEKASVSSQAKFRTVKRSQGLKCLNMLGGDMG